MISSVSHHSKICKIYSNTILENEHESSLSFDCGNNRLHKVQLFLIKYKVLLSKLKVSLLDKWTAIEDYFGFNCQFA